MERLLLRWVMGLIMRLVIWFELKATSTGGAPRVSYERDENTTLLRSHLPAETSQAGNAVMVYTTSIVMIISRLVLCRWNCR